MIFDKLSTVIGIIKIMLYNIIYFKRLKINGILKIKSNFIMIIDKISKVSIGKKVQIRNNAVFKAVNGGKIYIGNGVFINDGCQINALKKIVIGNNVLIGHNFLALDHDHDYRKDMSSFIKKEIIIGDNVWIGANVTILKGVTIGDNVVIGANTTITRSIESGCIVYDKKSKCIEKIRK